MLLQEPIFYYKAIRARFANSYLAEDTTQTIIGIDCDYVSASDGGKFDDKFDGAELNLGAKFDIAQANLNAEHIKFNAGKSALSEPNLNVQNTDNEILNARLSYYHERTDFTGLRRYFEGHADSDIAPFAGLFGVLGYESVRYFEDIPPFQASQYDFPSFLYANARAYLHFDKTSKIYTFYGDEHKYYDWLKQLSLEPNSEPKSKAKFKLLTDMSVEKTRFEAMVETAKEYIKSGDIFQVVLSEQLKIATDMDSLDFYECLSAANPSPYMFHFATPYGEVVGSSPELVFEMRDGRIFVAPIAGTRPRGADANEDERLKSELLADEKELAEHKMLIDLARNDIGRVARSRSVVVKNPMHIQLYESVMHIASDVYGVLDDGRSAFDVIASVFPAGTLSGTPKIRAMQIISELEPFARNIYGGGIGFLHFNGDVQMAILIRSAFFANLEPNLGSNLRQVFVGAGAGIVYDSVSEREYAEICHKRASVLNVFKNHCEEIK